MHYYKRHIGDYAKKAGHLSVLEHGVYTLLLDAYYDREQPPTRAEAVRIARCRTDVELAALDAVLSDFFHEVDGRYVQDRVEEEFTKAEAQARANQANGVKGGRPRKPKGNPQKTHSVSGRNPNGTEKNPNPLIHQSTNSEKQKPAARAAPVFLDAPSWLDPVAWSEWCQYRKGKKWTASAQQYSIDELHKLFLDGYDPIAVIRRSIANSWTGLFGTPRTGESHAITRKLSPAEQVRAHIARAEAGNPGVVNGHADPVGEDGRDLRPPLDGEFRLGS